MPSWISFVLVQFEDPVLKKINNKNLLLLVYISVLEGIFFDSLSDFSATIFLCISCFANNLF